MEPPNLAQMANFGIFGGGVGQNQPKKHIEDTLVPGAEGFFFPSQGVEGGPEGDQCLAKWPTSVPPPGVFWQKLIATVQYF